MKLSIFGIFLALIFLSPLLAQDVGSTNTPSAGTNSVVAIGQAPDDVLAKLAGLIHAGKYPEAQQLTAGLLLAYPDDQRLVKAKTLLDKLAAPQQATPAPTPAQPANTTASNPQPASTPGEQLAGMDKVDYSALIDLARQAQQTTDVDQQRQLLQKFMADSSSFLETHPKQTFLWQIRAASAMTLDDPNAGYEAGQKLLAAGGASSNDPNILQLLGQLKNKGWLDKQKINELRKALEDAKKEQVAVINTTLGAMVFEFWPDTAPNTVANFEKLARAGFYDGTCFHRIIKGFMIQGGDPLTKDPSQQSMWGTGGPGYTIKAEFNDHQHRFGVISMARSADPDSGGSQFFICDGNDPSLDGQYTTFGHLIRGDDVLKQIADTPVGDNNGEKSKPLTRIGVVNISIVPIDSIK